MQRLKCTIRVCTQGGVHVQDRGNVALPVDIVKVLKSQDENYIRTMRTAGLKVRVSCFNIHCFAHALVQKIDKLKNQLSALADLVKPLDEDDEELGEEEMDVLREAGILPPVSKSKRRRQNYTRAKHIVFAENEDEGVYPPFVC